MSFQFSLWIQILGLVLFAVGEKHPVEVTCRLPTSKISYARRAYHARPERNESTVLGIQRIGTRVSILVYAPHAEENQDPNFARSLYFKGSGGEWEAQFTPVPSSLAIKNLDYLEAPSDTKFQYKKLQESGEYLRSEDRGQTWVLPQFQVGGISRPRFVMSRAGRSSYFAQFDIAAIHPRNAKTLFATVNLRPWNVQGTPLDERPLPGLYVSYDGGENWVLLTNAVNDLSLFPHNATSIGISYSDPKTMYAITREGLAKTTDGGTHWATAATMKSLTPTNKVDESGVPLREGISVIQFAVDPFNKDVVYLVTNLGLYRTLDGAKNWCLLNVGFDEVDSIRSLAINPSNPSQIFLGSRYGVFDSEDRGDHFKPEPEISLGGRATR